jgi:hypothetical protein
MYIDHQLAGDDALQLQLGSQTVIDQFSDFRRAFHR